MRSVLLGGRTVPKAKGNVGSTLYIWLPVMLMVAVIVRESTESFSGLHTSPLLRPVWQSVFGVTPDDRWELIHHLIRKTGHFLGYGTLGLVLLRGWLLQWIYPLRRHAAAVWRRWCFAMAILCTSVVASLDEIHQTMLPDRTGLMQDVVLDTIGALVLCSAVALLFWRRKSARAVLFLVPEHR